LTTVNLRKQNSEMTESEFLAAFNKPWQIPQVADEPFSQAKRPAAVLICLNPVDHELHIILTKRAAHLKHHAGQISFPGGKAEAQDKNLIQLILSIMKGI